MNKKFYIITPCKNEEENILKFINKVNKLKIQNYDYDIVFVDDGSEDNTWKNIINNRKIYSNVNGINSLDALAKIRL